MRIASPQPTHAASHIPARGKPAPAPPAPVALASATPSVATSYFEPLTPLASRLYPKLEVGSADDPAERAADAFADRVMGGGAVLVPPSTGSTGVLHRKCSACDEDDKKLQRKETGGASGGGFQAPAVVHRALSSAGMGLHPAARSTIETRAGVDLSGVRVHTDALAAESAAAVGAKAYTVGSDLVFGAGQYQPGTQDGLRLIAHEVGHLGSGPRAMLRRAPEAEDPYLHYTVQSGDGLDKVFKEVYGRGLDFSKDSKDWPLVKEIQRLNNTDAHSKIEGVGCTRPGDVLDLPRNPDEFVASKSAPHVAETSSRSARSAAAPGKVKVNCPTAWANVSRKEPGSDEIVYDVPEHVGGFGEHMYCLFANNPRPAEIKSSDRAWKYGHVKVPIPTAFNKHLHPELLKQLGMDGVVANASAGTMAGERTEPEPAKVAQEQLDPDANVSLGLLDEPLVGQKLAEVMGEPQWAVFREFMRGLRGGVESAPPEQKEKIKAKFANATLWNYVKFAAGATLGTGEGVWISVKGLLEGVWTLMTLPMKINSFLAEKLPDLANRYGPKVAKYLIEGGDLKVTLAEALVGLLKDPRKSAKALALLFDAIKGKAFAKLRELGHGAAGQILGFLGEDWFPFGQDVGKVCGQIAFEVALLVATDAIANVAKEALAVIARIAAPVVEGIVAIVRRVRGLFASAMEWLGRLGPRMAGEFGELVERLRRLVGNLVKFVDELAAESAVADTGTGIRVPVSEAKGPTAYQNRSMKPPGGGPKDLHPNKAGQVGETKHVTKRVEHAETGAKVEDLKGPSAKVDDVAGSGRYSLDPKKHEYFFGKVERPPDELKLTDPKKFEKLKHNYDRSQQLRNVFEDMGVKDTPEGHKMLGEIFDHGMEAPVSSTHKGDFGTTVTRTLDQGGVKLEIKYFYEGGDMASKPKVVTVIPKVKK